MLGVDYHHRLSVAEAVSFCQKMPSGTLDFLEEPIRDETPSAYRALREMVDVPFAIGEEFASKWQFLPYIEGDLHQFNRIDVCNVGGLTEAMKVAGWSEAHYVDMMPHNPLGPDLHGGDGAFRGCGGELLVARNARLRRRDTSRIRRRRNSSRSSRSLSGAVYRGSDAPGLGVEVNEEAVKQSFRFWEAPHLRRDDGSVTNW